MSSFHYLTMYLNSFVPKTKHNCGCISQVCIYKGIFRFLSALCGLLGDKCSIASSCLVHKDQYCPYGVLPFVEQNNSFGRQITPEMGQNKSFGIENVSFGRQNKSFGIQNKSFGRQINPVMGQYKSKPSVK